ncbi:MAG: isoleucine--tRNA ligase [Armatimonadota bacterium]
MAHQQQPAWQAALNLPKTDFPMRAQLALRETEILRLWEKIDLYLSAQERTKGRPHFILHDGPPFCEYNIHLGQTLNKILKDIVVKFRSMQGYDAPFVPGWDTHGLPIEIEAIRSFLLHPRGLRLLDVRRRCAEFARKYIDRQRKQFKRLGVRGDWDRSYVTLKPAYEAAVLDVFGRLVEAGLVYRGVKPVHWCPECRTALAHAELQHQERSAHAVHVAFPVRWLPDELFPEEDRTRMSAAVWTTSVWALPAAVAVAARADATYVLVKDLTEGEGFTYLVERHLLSQFTSAMRMEEPHIIAQVSGQALEGATLLHPFLNRELPLVLAEYVPLDAGTGLAPVVPAHDENGYHASQQYGVPVIQAIQSDGRYGPEAGPFTDRPALYTEDDLLVRMDQDGTLLSHTPITRLHPHCWRCRGPVIVRVTPQWFVAVDRLRHPVQQAIAGTEWFPAKGKEHLAQLVAERPDWCISRQRTWGIPIPAAYCTRCDELLVTPELVARVKAVVEQEGSDAWFTHPVEEFLPAGTVCAQCGNTEFSRETDIFDVWFDSACSHLAVLEGREDLAWPADLVLEGHDQYRGWFQAQLLTAAGMNREEAPYRSAVVHGFVREQFSLPVQAGALADPMAIVKHYGADPLRLWAASADMHADITISPEVFRQTLRAYRRIRNTTRFLLGNLYDFSPEMALPVEELAEIDRWVLGRLNELVRRMTEANERYEFHRGIHDLLAFCANDLSAFYLPVVKEQLYAALPDDPARRSSQTACWHLTRTLAQLLAPVLSFTAEEIWQHLPGDDHAESVQLTDWPTVQAAWADETHMARWAPVAAIREAVAAAVHAARKEGRITHPAAAKVIIYSAGEPLTLLESLGDTLAHVLQVSAVELADWEQAPADALRHEGLQLAVEVTAASGERCPRCRWWRPPAHFGLCESCIRTVEQWPAVAQSSLLAG